MKGGTSLNGELNFWVLGGDLRQEKLAGLLHEDGHSVHTYALDRTSSPCEAEDCSGRLGEIRYARCVVLPLPVSTERGLLNAPMSALRHPLEEIFAALRPDQFICGGRPDGAVTALAAQYGLTIHDYFLREELAVANAVPTAEGAVQIALEEMGVTLHQARALVLGFGRVGNLTAHRLHAMGARVTVAARRCDALAWAEAYGYSALSLGDLSGYLCGYDLVVNTVPSRVLDRELLAELKEGCLVIDLASKPGGVDFQGAGELGVKCVWALSLPGKVAPITAGGALRDTIYNMLREIG